MVDNLLPEHVERPHVLDLAVHLSTWMGRGGGHSETFRFRGSKKTPVSVQLLLEAQTNELKIKVG